MRCFPTSECELLQGLNPRLTLDSAYLLGVRSSSCRSWRFQFNSHRPIVLNVDLHVSPKLAICKNNQTEGIRTPHIIALSEKHTQINGTRKLGIELTEMRETQT